jgi:hypothetical protein
VAVSEENEVTDEVDRANEQVEMTLRSARLRRNPTLPAIGQCYNCENEIPVGVFCDSDCRDDYEKRTRNKI